jgi:tetratricopeptide (TPR) repeat protein
MRRAGAVMLVAGLALAGSALLAQERPPAAPPDQGFTYTPPPAWKSVEIGNFYFRKKNYRGALSRYQEATHTNPDYAPAYLCLGKVYEKMGRRRLALKAYQRYLDELPSARQAAEAKDAHRAIARLKAQLAAAKKPIPRR